MSEEERFWTETLYLMKTCHHWFTQPRDLAPPLNCQVCSEFGEYITTPATLKAEAMAEKSKTTFLSKSRALIIHDQRKRK